MTTDLSHDVGAGADHAPTVSTRILHADRMADVGHGAVHAPMHTSVLYGYGSAQELQEVFQGHKPGFTYARQGNPTGAALEAKLNLLEETRHNLLRDRHGGDFGHVLRPVTCRRSCGEQPLRVRQHRGRTPDA